MKIDYITIYSVNNGKVLFFVMILNQLQNVSPFRGKIPHNKPSASHSEHIAKLSIIKEMQLTLSLLKHIYLLLIIIKFLNFRVLEGTVEILLTH